MTICNGVVKKHKIYYLFTVTACLLGGSRITHHEG
jgi:hypothetical protein